MNCVFFGKNMSVTTESLIDSKLQLDSGRFGYSANGALKNLCDEKCTLVQHDLASGENCLQHINGYADYLTRCWATHAGVVVSPSLLMYVTLTQVAAHISANAESYRQLFTGEGAAATEKRELVFIGYSVDTLTIDVILERLTKVMAPAGIDISLFCPKFSDSTERTREAMGASFCEAMESYFIYATSKCGLSKMRILGTDDDWELAATVCERLGAILFKAKDALQVQAALYRKISASRCAPEELKKMLRIDVCGSGHELFVGHFAALWNLTAEIGESKDGLPSANRYKLREMSSVKIDDTIQDAVWHKRYGVFSSRLDDSGYLVPMINKVVLREKVALSAKKVGSKRTASDVENDRETVKK